MVKLGEIFFGIKKIGSTECSITFSYLNRPFYVNNQNLFTKPIKFYLNLNWMNYIYISIVSIHVYILLNTFVYHIVQRKTISSNCLKHYASNTKCLLGIQTLEINEQKHLLWTVYLSFIKLVKYVFWFFFFKRCDLLCKYGIYVNF